MTHYIVFLFSILYLHPWLIALFTWIWNSAILFVFSTSNALSRFYEPGHDGMLTNIPLGVTSSWISKPLSAVIMSPHSKRSSSPGCSVISLSDMHPPHASETKLTNPVGGHPTSIFQVLRLFYWDMSRICSSVQMVTGTLCHSSLWWCKYLEDVACSFVVSKH